MPRFSISLLMAIIFLVAVDSAIVKRLWYTQTAIAATVITLPMANLLILTLPRFKRGRRSFWMGFNVAGWLSTCAFWYLGYWGTVEFFWPVGIVEGLVQGLPLAVGIPILIACAAILYTIPLALLSLLGGWLCSRYRVVVERRPA